MAASVKDALPIGMMRASGFPPSDICYYDAARMRLEMALLLIGEATRRFRDGRQDKAHNVGGALQTSLTILLRR
jgi:hypothetical protein